ncbi:MAG: membrane-bound lytic murein transglycosylase MltF [Gammaproteobacteria bacterium]
MNLSCKNSLSALLALTTLVAVRATTLTDSRPLIERILARGELVVVTRNGPTTYYAGSDGPAGFEYDLAKAFSEHLGITLKMVAPRDLTKLLPMVSRGNADLAAGFTETDLRVETFRFGPTYLKVSQQLIYRANTKRPANIADTAGAKLEVMAGSNHVELLEKLKVEHPEISWTAHNELSSDDLIDLLNEGVIDYTIANSNMVALTQRLYPELAVAFDLSESQQLAWAFAKSADDSLYQEAQVFFEQIRANGIFDQIVNRYYEHARYLNYVGARTFSKHIAERLPAHRAWFEQAGAEFGLDWRLLAALSYQESLWDSAATSPTGVRGLMMLTTTTANELGVENRLDPAQSIAGGARYLITVRRKIPSRIPEPDRTWMALAAYNIGFGHLEDARILTEKSGGDPDKWTDVSQRLPLLTQPKWYSQTRFGYARGHEPVHYVKNIRNYYDILVWHTDREAERLSADVAGIIPIDTQSTPLMPGINLGSARRSLPICAL